MKKVSANRDKIYEAAKLLRETVASTLGPRGYNVLIDRKMNIPMVTKDGVTVADNVESSDREINTIIKLIRSVASKMSSDLGDGTSTATLIATTLIESLFHKTENINVYKLSKYLNDIADHIVSVVENSTIRVNTDDKLIRSVINISANGDEELSDIIYNTMKVVKTDGAISVKESKNGKSYVSVLEGYRIDNGVFNKALLNQRGGSLASYNHPLILLSKDNITDVRNFWMPVLDGINRAGRPLIYITTEINDEVAGAIIANHMENNIQACIVKLEMPPVRKDWVMNDLALLTGATVIDSSTGISYDKFKPNFMGECDSIDINKFSTNIIKKDTSDKFKEHVKYMDTLYEESNNYDKARLTDRIARLKGSAAVIYIGGETESEIKERLDRVDDAMSAGRAALSGGVVAGGGSTLYRAFEDVKNYYSSIIPDKELSLALEAMEEAVKSPLIKIVTNSYGGSNTDIDHTTLLNSNMGYNAVTSEYCDMIENGIVDPSDVTKKAVKTATSIAALLLTTKYIIIEEPVTDFIMPI